MNRKPAFLFFFSCLLLGLAVTARADGLALTGLDGGRQSLADHIGKGKWTVVMLWSAYCGVCQYEAPKVEQFYRKYRNAQTDVLGISVDGKGSLTNARAFVAEHGLSFATAVAEGEDMALAFNEATGTYLVGTPAFLVYNPQGDLRTYELGTMNMAALERFIQKQSTLAANEGKGL